MAMLSKLEFQVMERLWANKETSIRQILEALAKKDSTKLLMPTPRSKQWCIDPKKKASFAGLEG
jgi:hypothetical protein